MTFSFLNQVRKSREKPNLTNEKRKHFKDDASTAVYTKAVLQIAVGGTALMFLFLACLSYMYGALYLSPNRHSAFHILAVDYDKGVIGQAMQTAYAQLKGPGFFTLDFRPSDAYPTENDMLQAVRRGDYWASIAVTAGASERLSAALRGGEAAATYDPSAALHYIWDQQYYTTYANTVVQGHMTQLVAATRLAYNKIDGVQASRIVNETDDIATQALLNPIEATTTNIHPATFGAVTLINTASMAMLALQQFFFIFVLNGVFTAHDVYRKMTIFSSICLRRFAGIVFTFGAALCQSGYYWAFREDWEVNGIQFLLTWITIWLLMHVHLLLLDSITTVMPLAAMPFIVLPWILLNNTSVISPLELQAGFYRWGISLPNHQAYSVLTTIWTGGAHNRLYQALPILFSWWVLTNITATLAHIRACHLANDSNRDQGIGKSVQKDADTGFRERR